MRRGTICAAYSRQVDLLLIDRRPLGSSLELADYGAWVRRQPLLALPGTPVWTTVQTQPSEGLRRQLLALQPGRPAADVRDRRPDAIAGLYGHFLGQPRVALPLPLAARARPIPKPAAGRWNSNCSTSNCN